MRTRKLGLATVVALACALALTVPVAAHAMVLRQGQDVTVRADETINDDVYAFGSNVSIDGLVNGDVIAAGQTVVVTGHVTGGVFGAGQVVRVTGPVGGSIRAAGQSVDVAGRVGNDAVLAGQTVTVGAGSTVGRDVAIGGTQASVLGDVARNVDIGAQTAVIGGSVGGNARVQGQSITVLPSATIDGNFDYYSDSKPQVQGTVAGTTTGHAAPANNRRAQPENGPAAGVFAVFWLAVAWAQGLVGMVLFGLLLMLILPTFMRRSTDVVLTEPWPSLGFGCLTVVFVPAVALMVFLFGLLVGGWWIAFVLLSVYAIALVVAPIVGALAFGTATLGHSHRPIHPIWLMLFGLAAIWVVALVPLVGWLAGVAALLFGLGAIVVTSWHGLRAQHPHAPRAGQPPAPTPGAAAAAPSPAPPASPPPAAQ